VEIRSLGTLLNSTSPLPDIWYHSLYYPKPSGAGTGIGKLMGKVVMNLDGLCIQVFQLSAPLPNSQVKEEKWTPLGSLPWKDWSPLGAGCPGYDKSILIGSNVSFDTATFDGVLVPNRVELAIVLNSEGNERYSNWKVTPNSPTDIGNRLLPAIRSIKTLQEQHWEALFSHADQILPPKMMITENFMVHKDRRPDLTVKSLSTFLKECIERRRIGLPLSFDPLFSAADLNSPDKDVAILIETNDTTQHIFLQILNECLDNEASGSLSRSRKQVVRRVYVTVSLGQSINSGNIYELGADPFMHKEQNPYLSDIVFLENETYLRAYSSVPTGSRQIFEQKYLTDPTNRGMLVLETFSNNNGEKTNADFTILKTIRNEKEAILDSQRLKNRTVAFRFAVKHANQAVFDYLVANHNLTVTQDFTPPYRTGLGIPKRFRYGTFIANTLNSEQIEELVGEFNTGGDFFLMKNIDQQGKDPNKTYFSTEMRKFSKQNEGRAALKELVQAEHKGHTTFWPAPGSLNKFWVAIDKSLTLEQITNLLTKANKIQDGDRSGQLKTFLSFAMRGITTQVEKTGGGNVPMQRMNTTRRVNTASISISGWPDQVEPALIGEILKGWGVVLDINTVSFEWFFSAEADGYTLRIQLTDLVKARELLELSNRQDFEFGIAEITARQQSRLRLIATSPRVDAAVVRARYPKPNTPSILSATQLAEIKKSVSNPITGNPQPKEVEKTILGNLVQQTSPKHPSEGGQESWQEVTTKTSKKAQTGQPKADSPQEEKEEKNNTFGVLMEHGEEEEEKEQLDTESEQEEKEEKTEKATEEGNPKETVAAVRSTAKSNAQKKFTNLKGQLSKLKLWGKDTPTIVGTYSGMISELGLEVANDTLEDLLKLPGPEVKDRVTARITGKQPVGDVVSTRKEANLLPPGSPPSPVETKDQNEEDKTTEEGKDNHASGPITTSAHGEGLVVLPQQTANPEINPISEVDPEAGTGPNLGKGNGVIPIPYSDPPSPIPPEVHKEHLPDTEAANTTLATFNLSSNEIPKKTITGYFPRTEKKKKKKKQQATPPPPSLSQ
jgi:hypothetical protein